jgi:hypothetical protein
MSNSIRFFLRIQPKGIGFMLTSQFLTIHTDFHQSKTIPAWMTPSHPNWIGAWWLPFIIFGLVAAMFALIICMFPKRIDHEEPKQKIPNADKANADETTDMIKNACDTNGDKNPGTVKYAVNGERFFYKFIEQRDSVCGFLES